MKSDAETAERESAADAHADDDRPDIGWARAIGTGAAVLLAGYLAVDAANVVVTKLTSVSRTGRQYLASAVFVLLVLAIAWVLRRLQSRRLI